MGVGLEKLAAVAPRSGWAHDLRAVLQQVTTLDNFRACGTAWAREVRVVMAPTGETRRIGVHSCCCCWVCPVCWSRRRIQERGEIVFAGGLWLAGGGALATATVTVPHEAGEPLEAVLGRLDVFAATLHNGANHRRFAAWGVEGMLRATEVTWGGSGWHPHIHTLWWLREPWDEATRAGVREWWRKWHRRHWEKKRGSPLYKPEHDPYLPDVKNVEPADLDAVGNHITKGPSKSTVERYWKAVSDGNERLTAYLAPFAIGTQAAEGDEQARALWAEYEQTMARQHWVRWPRGGFRDRFGLGLAGKEPALKGEVVAVLPGGKPRDGGPVQGRGLPPLVGGPR